MCKQLQDDLNSEEEDHGYTDDDDAEIFGSLFQAVTDSIHILQANYS